MLIVNTVNVTTLNSGVILVFSKIGVLVKRKGISDSGWLGVEYLQIGDRFQ